MKMKIAQIDPLIMPLPPKKYGGIERMVFHLTEELVSRGHDVTLFARANSETRAKLVSPPLFTEEFGGDIDLNHAVIMSMMTRRGSDFDIIHVHSHDIRWLPFLRLLKVPYIVTYHNAVPELPGVIEALREFSDAAVVSISDSQREPAPWLNWQATIYNGLP